MDYELFLANIKNNKVNNLTSLYEKVPSLIILHTYHRNPTYMMIMIWIDLEFRTCNSGKNMCLADFI